MVPTLISCLMRSIDRPRCFAIMCIPAILLSFQPRDLGSLVLQHPAPPAAVDGPQPIAVSRSVEEHEQLGGLGLEPREQGRSVIMGYL